MTMEPLIGRMSPRILWLLYALALSALATVFFAPLGDHLLDTHDGDYLLDSADSLADASFFFAADKRMPGRPFFEAFILAEYVLWGSDARLFHLAGVVLHVLAAWLLAYTCWRLQARLQVALITGWLFLINSAPFQVLQWISAHCYPLALLCMCGGLLAYISYTETGHRRYIIIATLLWLAGLLSHISAAAIIPFACYMAWKRGRGVGGLWRTSAGLLVGASVGVVAIKLYYRAAPQNSIAAESIDLLAIVYNYLFLWGRLIVSAHWLPQELGVVGNFELAVGVLGIGWMSWSIARRISPWDIVALWVALMLLPPLLLDPTYIREISAGPSRYLYLSSAGIALLEAVLIVGMCALFLRRQLAWGQWVYAVVIITLTTSSIVAVRRVEAIAYYNEGRNYLAKGQIEFGVTQLQKALAIRGGIMEREDAYVRLCPMVLNRGGDARNCLNDGRQFSPRNPTLHIYQQVITALDGDVSARRRLDSFRGKAAIGPVVAEAYYHAGRGAFRRQDYARAVKALSRSLAFDAQRSDSRQSLRAARSALAKAQL
ncbi:MAG: tetratricopeptide repeat protein [Candidatus Latescibacterota bacterium]|jgi:tetratricopeptide (TPR) repeat protein